MGLDLERKQAIVAEVRRELARAQAVVLAEYRSLRVDEMTELRRRARRSGVYLRVLKNTLARRAVADTPFRALAEHMVGPLAYGIATDPVALARVLQDFARENERLVIKAGAMPELLMSPREVAELAKMPSRAELLAQLLATLQAPIAQFVRTLAEVPARFVRTLAAVREQKEKGAA